VEFLSRTAEQIRNVSQPSDVPESEDFTPTGNSPEVALPAEDALHPLGSGRNFRRVRARPPGLFDGVAEELRYRAQQRSRVVKKEKVSVTLQRDEPSVRNSRRQFAARFERYKPIVSAMDHQGWYADLWEQISKIQVIHVRNHQLVEQFGRHAFLPEAQVPLQRRGVEHVPKHTFRHGQ
jgi:hypothetical protein